MRRFTALLALFVLTASSIVFLPARALACPPPPLPLRSVFLSSDLVVVATLGAPGKWELARRATADDQSNVFRRRFPLKVEETIKGSAPDGLTLTESDYNYLNEAELAEQERTGKPLKAPAETDATTLSGKTERRLFFLSRDEAGSYRERYFNRPFEPAGKTLDLFVARLRELSAIYRAPQPSAAAVTEWLVAMAEDPLTRYEGAFELSQILRSRAYEERNREEEDAPVADAVDAADGGDAGQPNTDGPVSNAAPAAKIIAGNNDDIGGAPPAGRSFNERDVAGAGLSPVRKERLVQAYFSIRYNYEPEKTDDADTDNTDDDDDDEEEGEARKPVVVIMSEADDLLAETAGYLKDSRVTARMLAELPQVARHEPYTAWKMMDAVADHFGDKTLAGIVDKFSDALWGGDNEPIEDELGDDETETGDEIETEKITTSTATYGQRRAELLQQFQIQVGAVQVK